MSTGNVKALVLDSWAVIAHFQGDSAARELATLISETLRTGHPVLMTTVNAGEVWYTIARVTSSSHADETLAEVQHWGVEFVETDWPLAHAAAVLKASHRLPYADAFAAALTRERKGLLVTGDADFRAVEEFIRITWMK